MELPTDPHLPSTEETHPNRPLLSPSKFPDSDEQFPKQEELWLSDLNEKGDPLDSLYNSNVFKKEKNLPAIKKVQSILADQVSLGKHQPRKESTTQTTSRKETMKDFIEDKEKFIGNFMRDNFRVMKGYIAGSEPLLRLYYIRLEPYHYKNASLCIVHGFGEHSGRFMDVKLQLNFANLTFFS